MLRLKHATERSLIFADGTKVKEVFFSDGDCVVRTYKPIKDDISGETCQGIVYNLGADTESIAIEESNIAYHAMEKAYDDKYDNDDDLPELAEILVDEAEITPEIEDCFYNLSGGGINTIFRKW